MSKDYRFVNCGYKEFDVGNIVVSISKLSPLVIFNHPCMTQFLCKNKNYVFKSHYVWCKRGFNCKAH